MAECGPGEWKEGEARRVDDEWIECRAVVITLPLRAASGEAGALGVKCKASCGAAAEHDASAEYDVRTYKASRRGLQLVRLREMQTRRAMWFGARQVRPQPRTPLTRPSRVG